MKEKTVAVAFEWAKARTLTSPLAIHNLDEITIGFGRPTNPVSITTP